MTRVIRSTCATIVCKPRFTVSSATRSIRYSARPRMTFMGVPISCAIPEATVPSSAMRSVLRKRSCNRFRSLMSRQMQKVRASKGKTLRPNATQSNDSGRSRAFSESTQRLQRTGSVDDAAAAIRAML